MQLLSFLSICMPPQHFKTHLHGSPKPGPKCSIEGPVVDEKGLSLEPQTLRVSMIRPHNKLVLRVDTGAQDKRNSKIEGSYSLRTNIWTTKEFSLRSGSN